MFIFQLEVILINSVEITFGKTFSKQNMALHIQKGLIIFSRITSIKINSIPDSLMMIYVAFKLSLTSGADLSPPPRKI
jgi:hypothetical protein